MAPLPPSLRHCIYTYTYTTFPRSWSDMEVVRIFNLPCCVKLRGCFIFGVFGFLIKCVTKKYKNYLGSLNNTGNTIDIAIRTYLNTIIMGWVPNN